MELMTAVDNRKGLESKTDISRGIIMKKVHPYKNGIVVSE